MYTVLLVVESIIEPTVTDIQYYHGDNLAKAMSAAMTAMADGQDPEWYTVAKVEVLFS